MDCQEEHINLSSQAMMLFTGTQHLSAIDILPGDTARIVRYGSYQLVTDSLNIAPYQGAPGDLLALISAVIAGTESGNVVLRWGQRRPSPVVREVGVHMVHSRGLLGVH